MQDLESDRGRHLDLAPDALAGIAVALPVQRLVLAELGVKDHRQQAGPCPRPGDDVERRRLSVSAHRTRACVRALGFVKPASRPAPNVRDPQCGGGIVLHEEPVRRHDPAEQRLSAASGRERAAAVARHGAGGVDHRQRVLRPDSPSRSPRAVGFRLGHRSAGDGDGRLIGEPA